MSPSYGATLRMASYAGVAQDVLFVGQALVCVQESVLSGIFPRVRTDRVFGGEPSSHFRPCRCRARTRHVHVLNAGGGGVRAVIGVRDYLAAGGLVWSTNGY